MTRAFRHSLKSGIALLGATWVLIATIVRAATGDLPVVSQTQDWVQVVKDVGFPITVSSVCLYVIVISLKEFTKSMYEVAKELCGLKVAVDNNTKAIFEVLLRTGRDVSKERP